MNNNIICDINTGICGTEGEVKTKFNINRTEKIDFYYFTDPICSHCYILEPIIKKFTHLYQDNLNISIVMGGLLEKWDLSNSDKNVAKPKDLYYSWQEMNKISKLPIDGRLWLDDYITSSFPASQVYEVIKKVDSKKAELFLRQARIQTFAFNQNISNDQVLINMVNDLGLDGKQIVLEEIKQKGKELLDEGFYTARSFGVTGYPTIIMVNQNNDGIVLAGSRPYSAYEEAFNGLVLDNEKVKKNSIISLEDYLNDTQILFFSEIQEMYDLADSEIESFINNNLNKGSYLIEEVLNKKYIMRKK